MSLAPSSADGRIFGIAMSRYAFEELDKWISGRVRPYDLDLWKREYMKFCNLHDLHLPSRQGRGSSVPRRWEGPCWAVARHNIDEGQPGHIPHNGA